MYEWLRLVPPDSICHLYEKRWNLRFQRAFVHLLDLESNLSLIRSTI